MQRDTTRIVWSWNVRDPADADSVPRHNYAGSASVNLLGGANDDTPDPPDADSFVIKNKNVSEHGKFCYRRLIHAALLYTLEGFLNHDHLIAFCMIRPIALIHFLTALLPSYYIHYFHFVHFFSLSLPFQAQTPLTGVRCTTFPRRSETRRGSYIRYNL